MEDDRCVRFLQWALPQLRMRWPGFRKVRKQVCKRIDRRIRELGLAGVREYKAYLGAHGEEWPQLDSLCRVTISRFCRDREVCANLAEAVLPSLAAAARERGDNTLRVWSAGCASGEEPYTLAILWNVELRPRFPGMAIDITATDSDSGMLRRAREARYAFGSLKALPADLRHRVFARQDDMYCLLPEYRRSVTFLEQDIRERQPEGMFDLVLCRNLVFTYFDDELQHRILSRIVSLLHDGGALVIGMHERLPQVIAKLSPWLEKDGIYRKRRNSE